MVLLLNQVTWWVCGEPLQTLRVDSGREPLPYTGSCPRLSCFSCHLAAHTWSRLSTRSIEPSLLVAPLLRGPSRLRPFVCFSSPAPTQLKPQPTPAILGQESVQHHVVNHSSHLGATIHQPSDAPVLRCLSWEGVSRVIRFNYTRWRPKTTHVWAYFKAQEQHTLKKMPRSM
jgi:hypothetical protein